MTLLIFHTVLVIWGKIGDPHLTLGSVLVAHWCYREGGNCSWLSCSLEKIGHQKNEWLMRWNAAFGEFKYFYSFNT